MLKTVIGKLGRLVCISTVTGRFRTSRDRANYVSGRYLYRSQIVSIQTRPTKVFLAKIPERLFMNGRLICRNNIFEKEFGTSLSKDVSV